MPLSKYNIYLHANSYLDITRINETLYPSLKKFNANIIRGYLSSNKKISSLIDKGFVSFDKKRLTKENFNLIIDIQSSLDGISKDIPIYSVLHGLVLTSLEIVIQEGACSNCDFFGINLTHEELQKQAYQLSYVNSSRLLHFIPSGDLKIDYIFNKHKYSKQNIIMFIANSIKLRATFVNYLAELIEQILNNFPKYKFVFRPFPGEANSLEVQNIIRPFTTNENFILDESPTTLTYSPDAACYICDQSTAGRLWSFATERPRIEISHKAKDQHCIQFDEGFLCYGTKGILKAIEKCFKMQSFFLEKIQKNRSKFIPYVGTAENKFIENIKAIIENRNKNDWVRVPVCSIPNFHFNNEFEECIDFCLKFLLSKIDKYTINITYFNWYSLFACARRNGSNIFSELMLGEIIRTSKIALSEVNTNINIKSLEGKFIGWGNSSFFSERQISFIKGNINFNGFIDTQKEIDNNIYMKIRNCQYILFPLKNFNLFFANYIYRLTTYFIKQNPNLANISKESELQLQLINIILELKFFMENLFIENKTVKQIETKLDSCDILIKKYPCSFIFYDYKASLLFILNDNKKLKNLLNQVKILFPSQKLWIIQNEYNYSVNNYNYKEYIRILELYQKDEINNNHVITEKLITFLIKVGKLSLAKIKLETEIEYKELHAEYFFLMSKISYLNNKFSESINLIKKSIKIQNDSYRYHNELSNYFFRIGDFNSVKKIANDMLSLYPKSGLPYLHLAKIHSTYNELNDAISLIYKAIETEPKILHFRNNLAGLFFKKGDFEEVIKIANNALAILPNQGWAYIQLANVHSARNELDDAIAAVQKAIEVQPDALHFRNNLAGLFFKKGDFEQVIKIANEALAILPNQGWAYIQIANIHNARNEIDDALAAVQKALIVQPDALHFRNNLAGLFFKKGDFEQVIKILNDALAILPNQGWAYIQLSNVHNARNKLDDAIAAVQKAIEVQPDALHFRNNLAGLFFKKGDYETVIKITNEALAILPNQGWAYIQLANVHSARNELDNAIAAVQKAIEVQPDALHFRNNLAGLFFKKGDFEQVIKIANEALAILPNQSWAYIQIANVHNARNEIDDALAAVQKALIVQPDALNLRNNLAGLFFKKGDFEQVIKIINDTLAILPNQGWAYIQLSNVYNARNKLDDAIAAVQKAIEVQPDALHFRNNLAGLFFKKGDFEQVIKIANEALAILPNQGWAYIQIANVHNARNEIDDALAAVQKALIVQPDALHLRNNLAGLFFKKGDFEQVIKIVNDALAILPNQGWAYIQLSNVHNARNKLDDAIAAVQKAIEVQPDALHFRNNLAGLFFKKGDYETVIKITNEALAILPNQGWAYIQLANVHSARNELDDAIAAVQKAIEVQPDALHFRNNLAGLFFKKGDFEQVIKIANKALAILPNQGWAYIQIANVHDARNELEDAILCAQKAIEVQPDATHYHKTLEKLLHKQKSVQAKVTQ